MTGTVLSVASRAVLEACEALGIDSGPILAAAGASRSQVFDPDARIEAHVADAIWRAADAASGEPDLALRAAAALPSGAYKVLDFVVANAPTVGEAIKRLCSYFAVVDQRGVLALEGHNPGRLVFTSAAGPLPPAAQQYTLSAIAVRLRASANLDLSFERAQFTFSRPANVAAYERIFRCPLDFDCSSASLALSATSLNTPIEGADPVLLSVLDDHAQRLLRDLPLPQPTLAFKVRQAVSSQLQGGDVSAACIARVLGLSERTLQRRLQDEGASFAHLLAEVRRSVAEGYLRDRDIALCEVAWLLGFSEHSAFTRAFKRWTGQSPGAFRAAHHGAT